MKNLKHIFENIPVEPLSTGPIPEIDIHSIQLDSRMIQPGDVFVAVHGVNTDGHQYIPAAINKGACAVIGCQGMDSPLPVPYIQVEDPRLALAYIAAALQDFPARQMTMIGVTGTDGKTSTSTLLYQILKEANFKVGLITTVNAIIGDEVLDTGFHVTTPEAVDVQRYLAQMLKAGLTHVILETTSHGLAQHRVAACEFDLSIVTNITHEHLDYHGSYENYRAAKSILFTQLDDTHPKACGNIRKAVLNLDDQSYAHLSQVTTGQQITYSMVYPSSHFFAHSIQTSANGMNFIIRAHSEDTPVTTRLIGDFNISNILAAYSAAVGGLNVQPEIAARGISRMTPVPGRMETIDLGQTFTAIVDFAHTPNALKVALETLRKIKKDAKIWAVFGSAGLRDREKRRMMAETSALLADRTILTAEDPRTESLDDILAMMASAAESKGGVEGHTFWRIPDRGAAIQYAVDHADPGDLVCAFGKGHEQSMCFHTTEYLWDDRTAMRAALARHLGLPGYPMPYLPTQEK